MQQQTFFGALLSILINVTWYTYLLQNKTLTHFTIIKTSMYIDASDGSRATISGALQSGVTCPKVIKSWNVALKY